MSVISSRRTVFTVPSEGFAIVGQDLDDISLNGTRRAWEMPGYADLLGFDQPDDIYGSATIYQDVFDGTFARARQWGVFTKGGGISPIGVGQLGSTVGAGMLGLWTDTSTVTPPQDSGANKMLWVMMDGSGPVMSHDASDVGTSRYDLVQVAVSEANGPTVQRDFEDATTGAKTSATPVTYKTVSLTFSVKKGTPSGSIPGVPAPDAGCKVVYAALITGTSISSYLDFTVPAGLIKVFTTPASHAITPGTNGLWTRGDTPGSMVASGDNQIMYLVPPFGGNGEARILGVRLRYSLSSGSEAKFTSFSAFLGSDVAIGIANVAVDGNLHNHFLDVRGLPGVTADPSFIENPLASPLWAGGQQTKTFISQSATALYIKAKNGDTVYGAEWVVLGA